MTRVLVTGATGYIGGRLAPRLAAEGHGVVVGSRDPGKLRDIPWIGSVSSVRADVTEPSTLREAMRDVEVAYYLVHSMAGGANFADRDRTAARNFADAAAAAGVGRIVYLGGLRPRGGELSRHLQSRNEVGDILLGSGVPTAALQAAVILGSGSASFEMLRYLTERLPAMVTPRWVNNRLQPIAIRDVLRYLSGVIALPPDVNRTFDVGGPDVLTYAELMRRYAAAAGLRPRLLVPVPVLTPRVSSYWINLVTPIPGALARPLVESLRHEVVCQEHDIAAYLPDPPEGLIGVETALNLALQRIRDSDVETRWSTAAWPFASDAVVSDEHADSGPAPTDPHWAGGSSYVDERETEVDAGPDELWDVIESIGGENGWYSMPLLWWVRGVMDRLIGGAGLRRGRRDPRRLGIGESLDWWRVERIDRGELLRLRAEMRVPGDAWLELAVRRDRAGRVSYHQRAVFVPRGLLGHLYWWVVVPFHGLVFGAMVRNIRVAAQNQPRHTDGKAA